MSEFKKPTNASIISLTVQPCQSSSWLDDEHELPNDRTLCSPPRGEFEFDASEENDLEAMFWSIVQVISFQLPF